MYFFPVGGPRGSPYGAASNALNYDIVVSEFELQSSYHVHFRTNTFGKGMKPLISPRVE